MQTATLGHTWVERRSIRRNIFAVLSALLALAVLMSVWWLTATSMMKSQISRFIEDERTQGRIWACGEWFYTGFPFRTEAQCKSLTATVAGASPVEMSVPSLLLTSSIFNPFHVWIEIGSPLILARDNHTSTVAQWHAFTAALRTGFGFDPKEMSVTTEELVINDILSRGTMKLAHGTADIRRNLASSDLSAGALNGIDINASADFLDFAALGAPGYRATFEGRIDGAAALLNVNGLDAFQKSGGRLVVDHLSLKRPKQDLYLRGNTRITDDHRLDGSFDIHATGIGNVLGGVVFNPDMDRDEIEIRLPVVVTNGVVTVGPYRMGELAPLY